MPNSVPTVFLTGQVRTDLMGTDGFQEADTVGITMPVVKHSFQVLDPARSRSRCTRLFTSPAPGARTRARRHPAGRVARGHPVRPRGCSKVDLPGYKNFVEGNAKQIRLAAKALANARRPVIYAGGGVINGNAAEELTDFVLTGGFPITCTVMGLGGFPAPHDQWLGMLGMHGTRTANYADGRGGPDRGRRRAVRRSDHGQAL